MLLFLVRKRIWGEGWNSECSNDLLIHANSPEEAFDKLGHYLAENVDRLVWRPNSDKLEWKVPGNHSDLYYSIVVPIEIV